MGNLVNRKEFWEWYGPHTDYAKYEDAYFRAMLEQAEHDPGSVDWAEIDKMMFELQRRDEEVDEAQGERTDWRT